MTEYCMVLVHSCETVAYPLFQCRNSSQDSHGVHYLTVYMSGMNNHSQSYLHILHGYGVFSNTPLPSPSLPPLPSIRSTACQWTTVALTPAVCLVCSQPIPCVGGAPLRDAACQQTAAARPAHSPVTTMLPAVLQLLMYHRSKLIL